MKKGFLKIIAFLCTLMLMCVGAAMLSYSADSAPELAEPTVKSAVNEKNCVKLTWDTVEGAEGYKIYKKVKDGEWKSLKKVKSSVTSFEDEAVESGETYIYRVRAVKGKTVSGYKKDVTVKYLSVPQNVTVSNGSFNGSYIKWSKVKGADSYKVFRKDSTAKEWKELQSVKGGSCKDTTAKSGVEYTYRVRAYSKDGYKSCYSSSVKGLCIHKPKKVTLVSTTRGVEVSWSKVSAGEGYKLYRKAAGEKEYTLIKKITSKSTTSYIDTGVSKGKTYIYTVRAYKGKLNGSRDSEGYTVKFVAAPALSLKHSPKGIVLKWSKASVGSGYEIQRKAEGEKEYKTVAKIEKLGTTTYTDKKPVYGKYNSYRVKLIYSKAVISDTEKLFGINPNKKMVALTYDDGPNRDVTNSILSTLRKYNSRATFFVVGSRVQTYKDCIIQADKQGCEIGNHSYNHTYLTSVSTQKINSEISSTNKEIKSVIGKNPELVRTPGGSVNSKVRNTVKYPLINWNVDTLDWKYRSAPSVVSNIKDNVKDGSIVLMHDLYASTATATKEIVPWLINKGYQLVTVSEMMAVKGVEMKDGTVYYGLR